MPTSYRIELSPNNRAVCKDTECKKRGDKVLKGTIRFGTWAEIADHAAWQWKHWGCVSGAQLVSVQESCSQENGTYNFDAIDGYDELEDHPEIQAKVRRAVEQGHIDPKDFNGDPEKNKPGERGIHLTAKQREKKQQGADGAAGAASESSDEEVLPSGKGAKTSRKRVKEDDEEQQQPAKKARKGQDATPKASSKAVKSEPSPRHRKSSSKRGADEASKAAVGDVDEASPPNSGDRKSSDQTEGKAKRRGKADKKAGRGHKAAVASEEEAAQPAARSGTRSKRTSTVAPSTSSTTEPAKGRRGKARGT